MDSRLLNLLIVFLLVLTLNLAKQGFELAGKDNPVYVQQETPISINSKVEGRKGPPLAKKDF